MARESLSLAAVSLAALFALALLSGPFPAHAQDTMPGDTNPSADPGTGDQGASDAAEGSGPVQLRLGFLLPYPVGDAAVPPRLADEWLTTAKLTLGVLAPLYENYFKVDYYVRNSNCSRDSAEHASLELVSDEVHAVVGPACSESVLGADTVLRTNNIPFISFAATADLFSSARFPTFFRTSFPDHYQARAIAAVVSQYRFTNIYIFYSDDIYGRGLQQAINDSLVRAGIPINPVVLPVPAPPPGTPEGYQALFGTGSSSIQCNNDSTAVILATPPNVAQGILDAAMNLGKIAYPWWYLGTDGAVAWDLVGEGQNLALLATAVQGEIGVGPYDGVDDSGTPEAAFQQFYSAWTQQPYSSYPGLLTLPSSPRLTRPRPYVVNLIDAIWAVHEAAKALLDSRHTLTPGNVLACLRGQGPCVEATVRFAGASGYVAFNTSSGDRLTFPEGAPQPTQYKIQNLQGMVWQYKGTWKAGSATQLGGAAILEVTRPGPIPEGRDVLPNVSQAPAFRPPDDLLAYGTAASTDSIDYDQETATGGSSGGGSTLSPGTLAALVILSTLVALAALGGVIYWHRNRRGRPEHQQFTRMI